MYKSSRPLEMSEEDGNYFINEKQLEVDAVGARNQNKYLISPIIKHPQTSSRYQSKRASQLARQTIKINEKFEDSSRITKPDPIDHSSNRRHIMEEQFEIDAASAQNNNIYLGSRITNYSPQTSTKYQSKAASQFNRQTAQRIGKLDDSHQVTKPDQIDHSSNKSLIIEASSSKGIYNNMKEQLEVGAAGTRSKINYIASGITISPQKSNRHQSKGASQLPHQTAKTTRNVVVLSQKTKLIHIDYSSKKSQNLKASSLRASQYSKEYQLKLDTPSQNNYSKRGIINLPKTSNSSQSNESIQLTHQTAKSTRKVVGLRITELVQIDYSSDENNVLETSSSKGSHSTALLDMCEEKSKGFTLNEHNSIAGFSSSYQMPYSNSSKSKGTNQLTQQIAKSKSKVVFGRRKTEPDHIEHSNDMRQILEPSSSKGTHNNKMERFELCLPLTYNDSESEESVHSLTSKSPQFTCSSDNTKQKVDVSSQTVINGIYSYNDDKHVESSSSKESVDKKPIIEPCSSKSHRTEVQPGSKKIITTVQENHAHSKIKKKSNSRELNKVGKSKEKHYNYESLCRHCKEEVYGVRTTKNSKRERKTENYTKSHNQVKNAPSGKKTCCKTQGNCNNKGSIVHSQKDSDEDDSWLFGLSKRITNLLPFCKTY